MRNCSEGGRETLNTGRCCSNGPIISRGGPRCLGWGLLYICALGVGDSWCSRDSPWEVTGVAGAPLFSDVAFHGLVVLTCDTKV